MLFLKKKDDETEKSLSDRHINEINAVYDTISADEQTFPCNASKAAVWEIIKDDTW